MSTENTSLEGISNIEVEDMEEDEEVEEPSETAMVTRDASRVEASDILGTSVVERKSQVLPAMSARVTDTSVLAAPICRKRQAIMPAAVKVAVVAIAAVVTEVAAVDEDEEVGPLHREIVNSRETNRDSPACARWGVPIEDHSSTDYDPRNVHGR